MLELDFKVKLPKQVSPQLMIYKTERPRSGRAAITEMQNKFKMAKLPYRPELRYVDNWTISKFGPYSIALNSRSGALRYRDEVRHGRELEKPFKIADQRAVDLAREFVDKTKLIKQPARDLKVAEINHLRTQGASARGQEGPEQILDTGVVFSREIDGVPVRGLGGHVMVNIAEDESVVAASKIWRHRDSKVGMANVLSPDYAVETLKKRLMAEKVSGVAQVLRADFCYFEAGDNDAQAYLEPSYAFVVESRDGEFLYKSIEVIPAIQKPKQRWVFRKQFPAPDVKRKQ
jgi:hypothetical protein